MSTTVLIAEDNPILMNVIMLYLKDDADIEVLAVGDSFAQTLKLATKLRPHVVVLDLHMGDENSVTPSQVKASLSGSRLIAMSIWNDDEAKFLAKTLGAVTLLDKATLATDLIPAIKRYAKDRL